MSTAERAPILLTPGPLTTSYRTRRAMMVDWGSWDSDFNELTASVCQRLLKIVGGEGSHTCVPLQGSGTFAVEAAIGTLVPRDGKVLVLINGAYGKRLAKICEVLQRPFSTFETEENVPTTAADVERLLAADPAISHVALIHCETSTGILNPLEAIAKVVERHGKRLIVDAMRLLRGDRDRCPESSVRCLDRRLRQVPGGRPRDGLRLRPQRRLEASAGNCHSLAMDLQDQHAYMRKTGQWRFTPPTHVVAALHEALSQYEEEGGLPARQRRYASNCETLLGEMARLGFRSFLPAEIQAPIIVTFHAPRDPRYRFADFYQRVREKGFILYPGKLTQVETFRVGCIGHVDAAEMRQAVAAIGEALRELEVLEI
ncbi:2-aminoethylphosphonate--pyruvate transaminase [Pseudomonas aeruginosa]|nr:2-aminoethylphosphonate--pyruvate transaminase [Pseudomonas aeruginosa]